MTFWHPIILSLQLAGLTTLLLLLLGTPLAWWLARTNCRLKPTVEAVIALPLILPPTVLGFYLLVAFGAEGPFSALGLAFSFGGLLVGSLIYSLPFVVQPLHAGFHALDFRQQETAATLLASPLDRFLSIALPQTKRAFLTAGVLGFAHTLGEFGVVLMIGGNIPGKTRTLSIAIFDEVEQLHYTQAHWLAGGLMVFSFLLLLLVYGTNRRNPNILAMRGGDGA